jgi:hypothetical protein
LERFDLKIWEPKESTLEQRSKRVFTVCKDYGLNVSLDKYEVMKISHKTVLMKKIKCNDHEMKEVKRFNYLGSKIIACEN